ncbi:phage exclusion lipoprotein Cor [Serratia marcescens]
MKKLAVLLLVSASITGCAGILEKQEPICYGTAIIAGQET